MKVLVTGGAGMLAAALSATLEGRGHSVTAADRRTLDITSPSACDAAVGGHDVVVNAAAWTAVDDAESHEAEAFATNATGAAHLARAARAHGARMLHLSTDYVFDGTSTTPYLEDAVLAPRSAYGRTKAAGEWAVRAEAEDAYIVRTAWLYGPGGRSFVSTMARLSQERDTVSVVTDQQGQPTTTRDVAAFVAHLIENKAPAGVYHATSEGVATWFELAQAVFEELGLDPGRVLPTTAAAFSLAAPRPAYSVLGHDRTVAAGIPLLPHWRAGLSATIRDVVEGRVSPASAGTP